jgi:hypothetical protein
MQNKETDGKKVKYPFLPYFKGLSQQWSWKFLYVSYLSSVIYSVYNAIKISMMTSLLFYADLVVFHGIMGGNKKCQVLKLILEMKEKSFFISVLRY